MSEYNVELERFHTRLAADLAHRRTSHCSCIIGVRIYRASSLQLDTLPPHALVYAVCRDCEGSRRFV